ncbi:TlpA disulfide reductase family protein [Flavobacterium silvaticum]|uniref:AhpC/TSA family protein n=1 Tax=Flavobacterium silvaticum TaxID=1852020 RepID=A0A972FJ43_9FLAO|nr:TlpA disulfide reductase family protein [Flavobacterium silvaticum]NMH26911.1 AhpC/TSA family protein [Flavobacterium silvaticum]
MKKALLALAIPALLVSCKGENEFTINGNIKGFDGKKVFLEVQDDSIGPKTIDTAKIENGSFKFDGEVKEPRLYAVRIESLQGKSYFIGEGGSIDLKINKDSLTSINARGTINNDKMTEFTKLIDPIQKEAMEFQKANQQKVMEAQKTQDTVIMNGLRKQFMAIRKKMDDKAVNFIKSNSNTYVALLLIKNRMYGMQGDLAEVEALYNGLDPKVKESTEGKSLGKRLAEAKKISVGKLAPDFSAQTPEGKTVSLKESLGKITIIDFWASWCGPCRKANPEMVALYNEFHDKGLNIIGVSLDKPGQADKWKEAIAKDGLVWTQVSNLKEWEDPIAKTYSVESIPQMFVLNQSGVVIAKDVHGEELRSKLQQALSPAPVSGPMPGAPMPVQKK